MPKYLPRVLISGIFITLIFLGYYFNLSQYINLSTIKENENNLRIFIANNYILSILIHIGIYIVNTSLSLPFSTILTLTGGFLFGLWGVFFNLIGATLGAIVIFFLSRYLFGNFIQNKYEKQLKLLNENIEKDGISYMLFTRLFPIFPFFVVNALSGVTKIKPFTFFWTTLIGIMPGTFVYTYLGTALSEINNIGDVLSPQLFISFSLLGFISLSPIILKNFKKK